MLMTPQYYQKHKEEILLKRKQYYAANKEKIRACEKERRRKNPRYVKASNVKAKYGITLEEYETRLQAQNGLCKICQQSIPLGKDSHLDHNHLTGHLRGFLCEDCNKGLGRFKDNQELLRNAIIYLSEYSQC